MNCTEWIVQGTGWLVLDGAVQIPSPRVEKFGSGVSSKLDHVHGVGEDLPSHVPVCTSISVPSPCFLVSRHISLKDASSISISHNTIPRWMGAWAVITSDGFLGPTFVRLSSGWRLTCRSSFDTLQRTIPR